MDNYLIKELLKKSIDKKATIYTINNFRYSGKIISNDDRFVVMHDYKSGKIKCIAFSEIKEMELENELPGNI